MKDRVLKIYSILLREYPDAACTLNVINPEFFLFSNILSPQCTDKVANSVAKNLYDRFRTVEELSKASTSDISEIIRPCGMHNVKSKHISMSAKMLFEDFRGKLPDNIEDLVKFPGIGRKTALVILHEIFRKNEGIVIDTHNIRIANRLGLTSSKNPVQVEKDLMKLVPKENWRMWSHLMVAHGRKFCLSQNPKCLDCPIKDLCEFGINL